MNALATIRRSPGLDRYLELLEERLQEVVRAYPGLLAEVGADTLAAGGKRLRPLLVFLSTPPDDRESSEPWPAAPRSSSCTWPRSSTTT